ncbi:unnamed protein product [Clonostachys byssicola]|uniref:UDENN FLCN/SMCR8-type domain-containing protein n=1 Tax=Clonostachys byssicola TaxID=160290 RepID=A0A9N9UMN0_9HYPO|nr:unnamed protein product [Clonostachys byssicola]
MGRTLQLIANLQLSLAHYCDIHGPTPLMVTEGLPTSCNVCYDDFTVNVDSSQRPTASQNSTAITKALHDLAIHDAHAAGVPGAEQGKQAQHRPASHRTLGLKTDSRATTMIDTPPGSPHQPQQQSRLDSSFRRTYDDTVTKKQGPCDNCAMTLPRRSASDPGNVDASINTKGPTLRTRAPAERVFGAGGQQSPPNSQSSSDTDGEREASRRPRHRKAVPSNSRTTSCSSNSMASEAAPFHVHYVNYTSTHEPVLPNSFSLLRSSCLRTLSFETLPRPPTTAAPATSIQPDASSAFVTTQSAGSAASGGPIFFGDVHTGYTTAYIFRIPDVTARGHKRVYAFIALSTHKERLAMKTFAIISAAFREFATWIQQLAEAEAERTAETGSGSSTFYSSGAGGLSQPTASAFDPPAPGDRGSSFLTGGGGFTRRMGGGGSAAAPKARGLADLVGQPDFFIELHRKFVQLLFEVGVTLNA